jgi:hypothetical protein
MLLVAYSDVIPSIGDRLVDVFAGEDPTGLEVVERYLVMDDVGDDRWCLVVKQIELNPVLVECLAASGEETKRRWDQIEKDRKLWLEASVTCHSTHTP